MARRRNVRNVAGLLDPLLSLRGLFLLQRLTLLLRMGLSRRLVRHGQPFTGGRRSRDSRRRPAGLPRTASLSATLLDGLICAPTRPRAGNGRSAGVCRSGAVLGWCVVGDSPGQSTSTRLVRSLAADYRATGVPGDVLTLRLWAYFAASDDAFTVHAGAQVGLQPGARRRCMGQPLSRASSAGVDGGVAGGSSVRSPDGSFPMPISPAATAGRSGGSGRRPGHRVRPGWAADERRRGLASVTVAAAGWRLARRSRSRREGRRCRGR
jgi:hypothetical protein